MSIRASPLLLNAKYSTARCCISTSMQLPYLKRKWVRRTYGIRTNYRPIHDKWTVRAKSHLLNIAHICFCSSGSGGWVCIRILAYDDRRIGIDGVLKINMSSKRSIQNGTRLYMNGEVPSEFPYDIEGSFSWMMLNNSLGLHPGRLARRCPNSPRIYALTCFRVWEDEKHTITIIWLKSGLLQSSDLISSK